MSRTFAVVKREYTESVRTKTFLFGTLFGPIILLAFIFVPVLLLARTRGERDIAVVDASGHTLAPRVALALGAVASSLPKSGGDAQRIERVSFQTQTITLSPGGEPADSVRASLNHRLGTGTLDAYLWLPSDVLNGGRVEYVAKNVTNLGELAEVRSAVQTVVQQDRLAAQGLNPAAVAAAMRPIAFQARKAGQAGPQGTPEAAFVVAYMLGFLVYMVVIMYGNAVLRGVLEEKRDRIVELVLSSIRAEQLMVGKVLGIGAAGLTQVLVWVAFAALLLTRGQAMVARVGASLPTLPHVPLSFAVVFVIFFAGGFLLYSTLYAAMGAIATTDQEAQQMQFPVLLPLIAGILIQQSVIAEPDGPIALWGSLIPLTSPVVMPTRAYLTHVPPAQMALSVALMVAGCFVLIWVAAKIYRIGILSTGKRPSAAELWRWLRTA